MRELLPDYSTFGSPELDMTDEQVQRVLITTECIDSEKLVELLHLLVTETASGDGQMSLAFLMDTVSSCGRLNELVDSKFFGMFS